MIDMQKRFKRAFDILTNESNNWSKEDYKLALDGELHLMWLRNEAKLWEDYVEDRGWIINGINYDPNHPLILFTNCGDKYIHENF